MNAPAVPWAKLLDQLRGRAPSLLAFTFEWWRYNAPLLERIQQIVRPPARVLEVGCGTGALSILLAAYGYTVVGLDRETRVVDAAQALADTFHVPCHFEIQDACDLQVDRPEFHLAFSAGVLEHFPPPIAIRMLQEQARVARHVLAVVPTRFALRNDPMTEVSGARVLSRRTLRRFFCQAGLIVTRQFGYGTPDGLFSGIYRHLLPGAAQWLLQNHLSYACSIGCLGQRRAGP